MCKSILYAGLILLGALNPSIAADFDNGQYFFRYAKAGVERAVDDPELSKDITAFFAGGVGIDFSQRIPMRTDWEDDNWVVTNPGAIPAGLSFDSQSLKFSGKPTSVTSNRVVELIGYGKSGEKIASASVTFDIFELPIGATFDVDLYAHTGKYSFNQLAVPEGITVASWQVLDAPPPGIKILGRNLDGTPSKAGSYRLLIQGLDFLGKSVVAFVGTFTVEDGPVFPNIPDKLVNIDLQYYGSAAINLPVEKVRRSVGKPRYFVEIENNGTLPGNLYVTNDAFNRKITGNIFKNYDQATIRYKAVDSDETVAFSNWFKLGTLGPTPTCGNYSTNPVPINLVGYAGSPFPGYYIPTRNSTGTKSYTLVEGQLPKGIELDSASGLLSGTPEKEENQIGVSVRVDVTNGTVVDTTTCGPYSFTINPARFDLSANVSPKELHVGGSISGSLQATGGLLPGWSVALDDAALLPGGVQFDAATLKFSGTVTQPGIYQPSFTLTNGDNRKTSAGTTFIARKHLAVGVPVVEAVPQYELSDALAIAEIDPETVVGSASITLEGGQLPPGMVFGFNGLKATIAGGTKLPPQSWGPYTFKATDEEGETASSDPFYLVVDARDELTASAPIAPVFTVKKQYSVKPVTVTLPPLANELVLSYTLNGPALPSGLVFDTATGIISGTPSAKTTVSGYAITVDDGEMSVTSAPFTLSVNDPAPITNIALGTVTKNVTGPVVSFITTPAPDLTAVRDFMVGDVEDAKFTSIEPSVPGLYPDLSNGTLSGNPTTPFNGDVTINFQDSVGRPGQAIVHLNILPYPAIGTAEAHYSLPRLADAVNIGFAVNSNNGFIGTIQYSLAASSGRLPDNVRLTTQGGLAGSTAVAPGIFGNIVISAKDTQTGIEVQSSPFSIEVVNGTALALDLPQDQLTYRLFDKTFDLSTADVFNPAPNPAGSRVTPLKWSIESDGGSGLTISDSTGQLAGSPGRLGSWPITIRVTDSDNPPKSAVDSVTVKATLQGFVSTQPGDQVLPTLRVGESFTTAVQRPENYVGNVVYSDLNQTGLSLIPETGVFTGSFETAGTHIWHLQATDSDGRKLQSPATFSASVIAPLSLDQGAAQTVYSAKQFDASKPVVIQFKSATNAIGTVSYGISDNVPGLLVYKSYPGNDVSEIPSFVHYDESGVAHRYNQDNLPNDALVFDTVKLTLSGIPSKEGSFGEIYLYASDDHQAGSSDPTSEQHNTAMAGPYTINVAKADDLVASNNLNAEVLYQYTSSPTVRSKVTNGAYGKSISFQRIAGNLPTGIIANAAGDTLSYTGFPTVKGVQPGIVYRASDAAGRTLDIPAVSFDVRDRQPLQLEASSNPRGMVVFEDDANLTVIAKNVPHGALISDNQWAIAGLSNLPAGVSANISNGKVTFTGTASVIGTYENIIVSAVDSLGGTANVNLTFRVISSSDPITVNVSNITTKVGLPVKMEPPFAAAGLSTDNTYGTVRFSSADIATLFPSLSINSATGALSGSLSTVQEATFNLKVNDGTNRLTSKPVKISVIPNLRIVAPTLVSTEQGLPSNVQVDTSFNIGEVNYTAQGNWPSGIYVDPATGAIKGTPNALSGTYAGLTIVGTDAAGDTQPSNVFSIKVNPIDALPVIANAPSNKWPIQTVGTAINAFNATVTDSVQGKSWPGPLTFTLNHDIEADTGLRFDKTKGTISGTPTKPILYTDLVMTVRTERGDIASTSPFWFGVQPKDAIVAANGQKTYYPVRVGTSYSTVAPIFLNTFGAVTYADPQAPAIINAATGVISEANVLAGALTGQPNGGWPQDVTVADVFGRKGVLRIYIEAVPAVSITAPPSVSFEVGADTTSSAPAITANVKGTATYTAQNMPSWLTVNGDGSVSGRAPQGTALGDLAFTVTVTDGSDGSAKSTSYTMKVVGPIKSYRVVFDTWVAHPSYSTCVGMSEFYVLNGANDITGISGVVPSSSNKDYPAKNLTDGVVSTASMWFITDGAAQKWIKFDKINGNKASAIRWRTRADDLMPCNPTSWHIDSSPDDVNWTTIARNSSSGAVGTFTTQIP